MGCDCSRIGNRELAGSTFIRMEGVPIVSSIQTRADISVADTSIEVKGGAALAARIYGKRASGASVPLVVHFHGGAFVSGDLDSGECMARLLAEAGAVGVRVGSRTA